MGARGRMLTLSAAVGWRSAGEVLVDCSPAMTGRDAGSGKLAAEADKLRRWLLDTAFPLWWQVGADHVGGGWHERIDFNRLPVALPKRSRVAARQVFCYCEAGRLGWRPGGKRHRMRFRRCATILCAATAR